MDSLAALYSDIKTLNTALLIIFSNVKEGAFGDSAPDIHKIPINPSIT